LSLRYILILTSCLCLGLHVFFKLSNYLSYFLTVSPIRIRSGPFFFVCIDLTDLYDEGQIAINYEAPCYTVFFLLLFDVIFLWLDNPTELKPPPCRGFEITFRNTTLGRTPQDECSACCRDLYLSTHNIHRRQTSMFPAGLETTIPASERPKTYTLGRAAIGIGI
jgi:hypothetical protein